MEPKKISNTILFILLLAISILFLYPIFIVFINSFKGKYFISETAFHLPNADTFIYLKNYTEGMDKTDFFQAAGRSVLITVCSVAVILLFTSMAAWFITRVKNKFHEILYYIFAFSMIVPFQMVMYTMTKVANVLHLDNLAGIVVIYLGFGSGMSVFLFSGFVKSIPVELEEAAMIDGCNPYQPFF